MRTGKEKNGKRFVESRTPVLIETLITPSSTTLEQAFSAAQSLRESKIQEVFSEQAEYAEGEKQSTHEIAAKIWQQRIRKTALRIVSLGQLGRTAIEHALTKFWKGKYGVSAGLFPRTQAWCVD